MAFISFIYSDAMGEVTMIYKEYSLQRNFIYDADTLVASTHYTMQED